PRPGRPAAHLRLGGDAVAREALPAGFVLAPPLPRRRDIPHGASLHPPRRRAARRVRPQGLARAVASRMIPVIDGHNDTLLLHYEEPARDFFARQETGHIDLERARQGGLAGAFFAVFPPGRKVPG